MEERKGQNRRRTGRSRNELEARGDEREGGGDHHGEPKGKRQDCEAGRKRTHAKPRLSFKKGGKREPQQS